MTFLSTLSLRRATFRDHRAAQADSDFYPRSPCGERLAYYGITRADKSISIHALLAESDKARVLKRKAGPISIHALLAESDVTVLGIQHRVGISIHALLAESDPGTV